MTCCCVSGGLFERLEDERGRHLEEVEKSKVKVDLFDQVDKVVWARMNLFIQETKEWLNGGDGESKASSEVTSLIFSSSCPDTAITRRSKITIMINKTNDLFIFMRNQFRCVHR